MKKSSTIFLQVVIVLIGIVALAIMIRFPLTEGRAVNLDLFSIYADPFLVYGYLASIPFFIALYQAFKLLGYIGQNKVFSPSSVKALRTIKYCAFTVAGAIVAADAYLMIAARSNNEDAAGAVMLGIIAAFASIVVGTATAVFERRLQNASQCSRQFAGL